MQIVCNGPYPLVLSSLAGHWGLILNADTIAEYGNDLGVSLESIDGTGPYTIKERIWGESFDFVANPNYFEGEPSIKNINFVIIPDAASRTIALETGAVDLICNVNASDIQLLQDEGLKVEFTLSNGQYFFMYNCSEYSVCHDPKVRLAINHAVDTEAIVAALYADVQGEVPTSFATARDYGTEDLGVFPYDPELSKQLLAEAGYPDGITIKLFSCNASYVKNSESAEIIKQMCAQVGINIEITVGDNAAFNELFGHTAEEFYEELGYDMFCMARARPRATWAAIRACIRPTPAATTPTTASTPTPRWTSSSPSRPLKRTWKRAWRCSTASTRSSISKIRLACSSGTTRRPLL